MASPNRVNFFSAVHSSMQPEAVFDKNSFIEKAASISGVEVLSHAAQSNDSVSPILSREI